MEQITINQKRLVNGTYRWVALDLLSADPFRWVTGVTWKSTLMADDYITINLISKEYVTFSVGDWCVVNNRFYSVRSVADVVRGGDDEWRYTVIMYGVNYDLIKCIFRDCDVNGKSSSSYFDLTYTLEEFVKVVVYNMNRATGTTEWEWGNSENSTPWPETDPITISFQRTNCLRALQDICQKFDYEFRITQHLVGDVWIKTITVGEFDKTPRNDVAFAYGLGDGLYQLKECKVDDSTVITRLWVEGGSENIRSSYRNYAQHLQLPFRRLNQYQHDFSDGSSVAARSETIGITDDGKRYLEDAALIERYGIIEDSYQTDEIYPRFTGTVHSIGSQWSGGNGRLQFRAQIGFNLNARWAAQGSANFESDYKEWCYINGYYRDLQEDYERFCLLHNYTDEYHQYLEEQGYTEAQLSYSGWTQLIMQGLITSQTYTAFEVETGTAMNAYRSISEGSTAGTKYLIDSSTCAKIAFISGRLAGQTFDVNSFTEVTVGGVTYGQFTINERTEDESGTIFPSRDDVPGQPFRFTVGDRFKIIDIFLPYAYYVMAEEELWYDGKERFEEVKQPSYKYDLTFDIHFIKENEAALLALEAGQYIKVADERFFSDMPNNVKNMRITGIDIDLIDYKQFKLTLESVHKLRRRHIGNNVLYIDDAGRWWHEIGTVRNAKSWLEPSKTTSVSNLKKYIFGGGNTLLPTLKIGNRETTLAEDLARIDQTQQDLSGKLNSTVSSEDAGKVLTVGQDGSISPEYPNDSCEGMTLQEITEATTTN